MKLEYKNTNNQYKTVKEVLEKEFKISKRLYLKLKRNYKIFVNNQTNLPYQLQTNDTITADISFEEQSENIVPTKIDLDIIFEDDSMIIINKPANMPVHPSQSHFEDSLSNGIQYYFLQNNIKTLIRPVNRLDKDTSGLVIFAKNQYIQEILNQNIIQKNYKALLIGNLNTKSGTINAPISRKQNSIIEREINEKYGKKAITYFQLIKNYTKFCLVEFNLETGRTHQIRVHAKHIGHPILGDFLYGEKTELISRQALHAYKIKLIHPITQKRLTFETNLPTDMQKLITL